MQYPNKNKLRKPVPSVILSSIILASAITPASPLWAFGGPWKPRQTLNIQGGHGLQDYYDALLPLAGNANSMFYANGSLAGNHHVNGGDLGLGYRQIILNNEYVIGGFALIGRYQTNYHNMYNQLTLGTELFGTVWEGRAHLYEPVSKKTKFVGTRTDVQFQGHKLFGLQTLTYERAGGGADVEVGRVVPWIPQLRGFAGYYNNGLGEHHKNVNGGYGRFEYRYNSHFIFTLSDSYDRYQGNFFSVGVRMSIGSPDANKLPLSAEQRMTDYSVRRRDIFTYTVKKHDNFTSQEDFFFVTGQSGVGNGTLEAPFTTVQEAIAASTANSNPNNIVYLCNCNGGTGGTYDLGGQLNIGQNTKLIGSGGSFTYNGVTVPSVCGNARPTLIGSLYLPGNNEVTNINLTGQGTTQNTGIVTNGSNITLTNLTIYNYTGANGTNGADGADYPSIGQDGLPGDSGTSGAPAYGILINNSSNVLISNVNVNNINGGTGGTGGNGGAGDPYNGSNGGDAGNGADGGSAYGILITNSSQVSLSQVDVSGLQAGAGNAGGIGGLGGQPGAFVGGNGGNGGNGGAATGLEFDSISTLSMTSINVGGTLNAGAGGVGGAGGASGQATGGTNVLNGTGGPGDTGNQGGSGGNGGDGGTVTGITLNSISSLSLSSVNLNGSFTAGAAGLGGDGGAAGTGGVGGSAIFSGNGGNGGVGGLGGTGGNGGTGGSAYGIQASGLGNLNINFNETLNAASGVSGGAGGAGGQGGNGGSGSTSGTGAAGGTGGTGGSNGDTGTAGDPNSGINGGAGGTGGAGGISNGGTASDVAP